MQIKLKTGSEQFFHGSRTDQLCLEITTHLLVNRVIPN